MRLGYEIRKHWFYKKIFKDKKQKKQKMQMLVSYSTTTKND